MPSLFTNKQECTMTIYTYIGGGETSPQIINFMGRQEFMIGEEVDVTDLKLLAKLKTHQCFVEGKADRRKIAGDAKKAKDKADAQRKADLLVNAREIKRRNK